MKRNLLIILIFVFCFRTISFSQTPYTGYIAFPEDSAQWSHWKISQGGTVYESTQYKMKGDTMINGISYNKIYESKILAYGYNDTLIHCFMRQDTTQKKVFVRYPYAAYQDTSEYLLYDFSLHLNDTFQLRLISDGQYHNFHVNSEDTTDFNFIYRRLIGIQPIDTCWPLGTSNCLWGITPDNTQSWVEGMGSGIRTFIIELIPGECAWPINNFYNLECFWEYGQYSFGGTFCDYSTGINESENHFQISITPNPFTELINIKVNDNHTSEFFLYDITSRQLLEQTFTTSTSINTEQLAKGIYIYEVRNKNGVIKKGKVVKD